MNLEHFPLFLRVFYSHLDLPFEDVQDIGMGFKTYLEKLFEDKMDKLEPIWDIEPLTIVINMENPIRMSGYHPALVLHFTEYVKIEAEKFLKENPVEAAKYLKELKDEEKV